MSALIWTAFIALAYFVGWMHGYSAAVRETERRWTEAVMSDPRDGTPFTWSELNWLAWGTMLGAIRQTRIADGALIIESRGPFGELFMRKIGLLPLTPP